MNNSIRTAAKTMAAVIAAGAMAVAPVAGTINFGAMTAMAEITATGTVSIGGLNTGDTVTLYKIVEATTDASGQWNGWGAVDAVNSAVSIATTGKDLSVNVGSLMGIINGGTVAVAQAATPVTTTTFTSNNLAPGVYVAVITPGEASNAATELRIYNPAFLSVSYDGTAATGGSITNIKEAKFETSKISNTDTTTALTDKAYAKSSTTSLTKTIVNKDTDGTTDGTQAGVKGEDLQKGDTSDFQITTAFPDYRGFTNLDNITFRIDDNQDAQFGQPKDIKVWVGEGESKTQLQSGFTIKYGSFTQDGENAYAGTLSANTPASDADEDFSITFDKATLMAHPATAVTVTYSSVLVNPAIYSDTNDNNDNNVRLTYTNKNSTDTDTSTNHKDDKTTDYSFKINVKKVDSTNTTQVLSGAKFKIERQMMGTGNKLTNYVVASGDDDHVVMSDEETTETDGIVNFTGLDEGYYKITETQAPTYTDADGNRTTYSQNTEAFYIKVVPTWNGDHSSITGYTINYVDEDGQTKTQSSGSLAKDDTSGEYTLTVKDTPVNGLPSTGARSALILTIAGIAVMVTVMAASRRRKISE